MKRIASIDYLRGLIMFLLAAESCLLYESLSAVSDGSGWHLAVQQFFHHEWHGLRFWDLVQPAFMTIAGTALYFSWQSQLSRGVERGLITRKLLVRCFRLFVAGTALHCVYAGRVVWELWNVLTQLSITSIITYLVLDKKLSVKLVLSFLLLALTELLYRHAGPAGYDQPFVMGKNFGSYTDMLFMGKVNGGGWVTINFIPTAAHTIWGACIGQVLQSAMGERQKLGRLAVAGTVLLASGYALDLLEITPIIKRISTSSFVLVSGGWVLYMTALAYWLVEMRNRKLTIRFFSVMGMNAIFIYLFFETVGHQWLNGTVLVFVRGLLYPLGMAEGWINVWNALVVLMAEWGLCYWLYRKNIFFKI